MPKHKEMTIAIGNDHAGPQHKFAIVKHLEEQGIKVINFGTDTEESMDYPDAIHPVATAVERENADFGIILCGSGNGAAMTANHHQNIRAALCWNEELVELARLHNNANILSLPARYITIEEAIRFVDIFLKTEFEGGRHIKRINKIPVTYC